MKTQTKVTIQTIRNMVFVGNFHSDQRAFGQIGRFAEDKTEPLEHRAEALRIMSRKGMGLTGTEAGDHLSDAELVVQYTSECS